MKLGVLDGTRRAADLYPGRSGAIAGRGDADRGDAPAVPPGGVHSAVGAADREADTAG